MTMRLIDADALVNVVETARKKARTLTGMDFVMVTKTQPTLDAIPVEWLMKRRDIYLKSYHAGHERDLRTAAILNDLIIDWRKEQKA